MWCLVEIQVPTSVRGQAVVRSVKGPFNSQTDAFASLGIGPPMIADISESTPEWHVQINQFLYAAIEMEHPFTEVVQNSDSPEDCDYPLCECGIPSNCKRQ